MEGLVVEVCARSRGYGMDELRQRRLMRTFEFLKERAVPDYQSTPGNRGVFLFRRMEGDEALSNADTLGFVRSA